eukprot:scaffold633_cov288-Ochromonas_danica.AAC.82
MRSLQDILPHSCLFLPSAYFAANLVSSSDSGQSTIITPRACLRKQNLSVWQSDLSLRDQGVLITERPSSSIHTYHT